MGTSSVRKIRVAAAAALLVVVGTLTSGVASAATGAPSPTAAPQVTVPGHPGHHGDVMDGDADDRW